MQWVSPMKYSLKYPKPKLVVRIFGLSVLK